MSAVGSRGQIRARPLPVSRFTEGERGDRTFCVFAVDVAQAFRSGITDRTRSKVLASRWGRGGAGPTGYHVPVTVDELDRRLLAVQGIVVLGRGPSALELADRIDPTYAVCVTHPTFATKDVFAGPPDVVLFGDQEPLMAEAAARFRGVSASERPVLVSHHMPNPQLIRTARYQSLNIPVPLPVVPRLAAQGLYQPTNDGRYPTSGVFLALLAASYDKPVVLAGVDLYRHPSGSVYVTSAPQTQFKWPAQHSEALDVTCLRTVAARLGSKLTCLGVAAEVVSRA